MLTHLLTDKPRSAMLNPQSPFPLYHQLADTLTEQIRAGEYSPGQALPSETNLAKQYGIGRPTVRQAMDILVRKGMLERKRGAGTFVRHKEHEVDLFSLAGTSQAFLTKGIKAVPELVEPVSLCSVGPDETNPFQGRDAFFLSRLTRVGTEPVLLEDFYFHPVLFAGLDKINLENRSLSEVVSDQYFLHPESARQTFRLSRLTGARAERLGLKEPDPVLLVERTLHFPGVEKAVFSRLYCRTDQFVFSQVIRLS
jgi:GntR family transcriptional regulator